MSTFSGIYKIENVVNSKKYIGSTVDSRKRWNRHQHELRKGKCRSLKLQKAWDKYGEKSFKFSMLLYCDKKKLIFYEQRALDRCDVVGSEYNIQRNAFSSLGHTHSKEVRAKISAGMKGRKLSDEHRRFLSVLHAGSKRTKETKKKMSIAQKGRIVSVEARKNMSAARKGVPWTENRWAAQEKRRSHV